MQKVYITLISTVLALMACGGNDRAASTGAAASSNVEISVPEAKRIYTMKCALCHGSDGKLMIGGAPDLTQSEMTHEERVAIITYGKGQMPPQKDVLTSAEIRAVAKYTESFVD